MNKDDVVKRLQATVEQGKEMEYTDGKKAGREWAEEFATVKELERLVHWIKEWDQVRWWLCEDVDCRHLIAAKLWPDTDPHEVKAMFWTEALGEDWLGRIDDDDFFHGFVDCVREVWREVADRL